jgi:molybdopterin-guanine dinucleotide biosynthesis protein A
MVTLHPPGKSEDSEILWPAFSASSSDGVILSRSDRFVQRTFMSHTPTIAIFAGGASRRLGQDKVALFLDKLLETIAPLDLPVLIVGRAGPDERFVPDDLPGEGPLGALATALRHAEGAPVLALACDLPMLTEGAVRWLLDAWVSAPAETDGLIVLHAETNDFEPLFSVYAPSCLHLATARLATGKRSLHGLIESGDFTCIELPEAHASCLFNVNRPEDLQALRRQ